MIDITNHLGTVTYSKQFFYSLIGGTVTKCFGVVEMTASDAKQTFLEKLPIPAVKKLVEKTTMNEKGVIVKFKNGMLNIELHISVMYGVNVATIIKSIIHKVAYVVEEETDLKVDKVHVYVDSVKV